jgi:Na+-driven multidrug efflux pump
VLCFAASNWLVGLPLQVALAFKLGWGVVGLWWALAAMAVLQAALMAALVWRLEWGGELRRAERLLRRMSGRLQPACTPPV